MTVYDLNRDQLTELKQHYYAEKTGEDLSYEELAFIDDYVSDREVLDYYSGTAFTPDDFFCSADDEDVYYNLDISDAMLIDDIPEALREIASAIEDGSYGGMTIYGVRWGLNKY